MFGQITAYSGTSLTINVVATNGSGTHTDWSIYGRAGPRGAAASGSGDFEGPASSVSGNLVAFGDTTGKLGADSGITPTAAGIAVLEAADAAAQRAALDLEPGVDVQAYDADLAAIAGLTSAADKGIQFTGAGTAATYDLTAAGKALLDDADAAAQRTTLGLTSASAAEFFAGTDAVKPVTADTVAEAAARVSLTSGTTINTDCSVGRNFKVTLGHNATFAKPTNMQDGVVYTWQINQPSSGGPYTGAFNAAFEFPSTPTLSTAASKKDLVSAMYDSDADVLVAGFRKGS